MSFQEGWCHSCIFVRSHSSIISIFCIIVTSPFPITRSPHCTLQSSSKACNLWSWHRLSSHNGPGAALSPLHRYHHRCLRICIISRINEQPKVDGQFNLARQRPRHVLFTRANVITPTSGLAVWLRSKRCGALWQGVHIGTLEEEYIERAICVYS